MERDRVGADLECQGALFLPRRHLVAAVDDHQRACGANLRELKRMDRVAAAIFEFVLEHEVLDRQRDPVMLPKHAAERLVIFGLMFFVGRQQIVLADSPATDVQSKPMGLRLRPPERPLEEAVTVESAALTIDGDRLSFTVPSDAPEQLNGPIELQLLGPNGIVPKVLGCPVTTCQVWISPRLPPLHATLR